MFKFLFYKIIDILTFKKGIKRKINGYNINFRPLWSRYYENGYEKKNFEFISSNIKEGYTVIDIGAHIGLYTSVFGQLVGKEGSVLAFEPTPTTFKVLQSTVELNNGFQNIKLFQKAIAKNSGHITFNLTSLSGEGSNANSISTISNVSNSIVVECVSIDEIKMQQNIIIDFIKIDVEGAELLAIQGAKNTFLTDRPIGTIGIHPDLVKRMGHTLEEIWDCMFEYHLDIYYSGKKIERNWFCSQESLFDIEFIPN